MADLRNGAINTSCVGEDTIAKGIILMDGFRITRHTTKEEMQHFFSDDKGFLAENYVICQKPKHVNGQEFACRLWFKPDGKIGHIRLTLFPLPVTEEEKKDRAKLQKALYRASESWLNREIGESTKETETSVLYKYDWGSIGCSVDEGPLSSYDGGSIIIVYYTDNDPESI